MRPKQSPVRCVSGSAVLPLLKYTENAWVGSACPAASCLKLSDLRELEGTELGVCGLLSLSRYCLLLPDELSG